MQKLLFHILLGLSIFPLLCFSQEGPLAIEEEIANELNIVRTDPGAYIAHLEAYKKLFEGKNVNLDGAIYETYDGVDAVDEALKFLKRAPKLAPFKISGGLAKSAQLQVEDLKGNTSLGLKGKDGSSVPQRARRFGTGGNLFAANIGFYSAVAKDIVMNMIIDDGVRGRGNRKNIFNSKLNQIGVAFGIGENGEQITLIVFADKFIEKSN